MSTYITLGVRALTLTGIVGAILLFVYGWVMNVINLINGTYEPLSTVILGFLGLVVPYLGAIVHFVAG